MRKIRNPMNIKIKDPMNIKNKKGKRKNKCQVLVRVKR
jgi:hypothetical protein